MNAQNVLPSNGNVGVATSNPRALLDVGKLLNIGELGTVLGRLDEGNNEGEGTFLGVRGFNTRITPEIPLLDNVKAFALEHSFYGMVNNSISFYRGSDRVGGGISFNTYNNTEQMRLLGNGNVGIGTNNPLARFHVNGLILAKEVRVEAGPWPDYVFKNDYKLPHLLEVEKFIQQNKHLPEVPSEEEVKEKGIKLGEMNAILLKKVEELTLYLIERVKVEKELQRQIDVLTEKNAESAKIK